MASASARPAGSAARPAPGPDDIGRRPESARVAGVVIGAAAAADGMRFAPGRRLGSPTPAAPAPSGLAAAGAFVASQRWSPSDDQRDDPPAVAGSGLSRRSITRSI